MRKHQHHEISDATVVAAIVITGIALFAAVLLSMLSTSASATVEPTPAVAVSVDIQPVVKTSSCWHAPWLPQFPSESICSFRKPTA
jgi:hypothetical protein